MIIKEIKANEIINKRNAVKEADCWDQGSDLISSEVEVVTFTDLENEKQQVVNTYHYTANFGTLKTKNYVHSDSVRVEHTFFQHDDKGTSTVFASETQSGGIHFGIGNNNAESRSDQVMDLFVNEETAVALANAILQAVEDKTAKGQLIIFKEV